MIYYKKLYKMLNSRQRRQFFNFVFASVVFAISEAISIGLLLPFFNILAGQDIGFVERVISIALSAFSLPLSQSSIAYTAAFLLIFSIFTKAIFHIWITYLSAKIPYEFYLDFGDRLNGKFSSTPWVDFVKRDKSELIKTLTKTNELVAYSYVVAAMLVSHIAVMIIMCSLLLIYKTYATTLILCFFGVVGGSIYLSIRSQQTQAGIDRELGLTAVYAKAVENLNNLKQIQVTRSQKYFGKKLHEEMAFLAKAFTSVNYYPRLPSIFLEFAAIFSLAAVALWAFLSGIEMLPLLGPLILYAAVGRRVLPTVGSIIWCQASMRNLQDSIEIIFSELCECAPSDATGNNRQILLAGGCKKKISFEDVDFSYSTDRKILAGITFEIEKGTSVAFVGPSGSGKSTLVDMICGLIKPEKGKLYIDNKAVTSFSSLQGSIGYVGQNISLISGSVADNIVFDGKPLNEELMALALKASRLEAVCNRLSDGVNTDIGDDGALLSGGERQRLAIARAIYNSKGILIFDEATSDLDNLTEQEFVNATHEISSDNIIISIAHRLAAVQKYDQIHLLDKGRIVASGTHQELIKNSKHYRNLASVYK